jgi:hypothetical protein
MTHFAFPRRKVLQEKWRYCITGERGRWEGTLTCGHTFIMRVSDRKPLHRLCRECVPLEKEDLTVRTPKTVTFLQEMCNQREVIRILQQYGTFIVIGKRGKVNVCEANGSTLAEALGNYRHKRMAQLGMLDTKPPIVYHPDFGHSQKLVDDEP